MDSIFKNRIGGGEMRVMVANQKDLTAECWSVQFFGLEYCNTCSYRDTVECGGKKIRDKGRNERGIAVPIGKEVV